jgi:ankyrin repeat protein
VRFEDGLTQLNGFYARTKTPLKIWMPKDIVPCTMPLSKATMSMALHQVFRIDFNLLFSRIIKFLLSKECDVDIRSEGGMTPLMCAAKGGKCHTLRFLWEEGAMLHARDNGGQTAAHYAAQEDHAECVVELLAMCKEQIDAIHLEMQIAAEENAANGLAAKKEEEEDGETASDGEDGEPPEPLSEQAVIDGPSLNGTRPLHVAASFDSLKVIRALLDMDFVEVRATNVFLYMLVSLKQFSRYLVTQSSK